MVVQSKFHKVRIAMHYCISRSSQALTVAGQTWHCVVPSGMSTASGVLVGARLLPLYAKIWNCAVAATMAIHSNPLFAFGSEWWVTVSTKLGWMLERMDAEDFYPD